MKYTDNTGDRKMLEIRYKTYSKILKRSFVLTKQAESLEDFELFALSLNLDYTIISVEKVL